MHPDAAKAILANFKRKEKLVAEKRLPDTDQIYERFAYVGHEVLFGYYQRPEMCLYRCVDCMVDWMGPSQDCPKCKQHREEDDEPNVYQLNIDRSAQWQCLACGFEWRSDDGEVCPECKKHYREVSNA